MRVAKGLWAMVQGDPTFMRRINGWFTVAWIPDDPDLVSDGMAEQRGWPTL